MTTPLKALIQERLRAKIVRQEIDGDDITDDVDDFASMDREIDLQSPSRLLMRQQQQSKQPGRRARRGSVDARGASAAHRSQRQPPTQDDHVEVDAAPSHRRQHKHHLSTGSQREKQQLGHTERRRHHHHHHHHHPHRHHSSSHEVHDDDEEQTQPQPQQLGSTASETILDYYAYDHNQKFGSFFGQDHRASAHLYTERYTPQQLQQHEPDVGKGRKHHAQTTLSWEHHRHPLSNQFDTLLDQTQKLQADDPHPLLLASPRFAPLQSSSRAQQQQRQQYSPFMPIDSDHNATYDRIHECPDTRAQPVTAELSGGDFLPLRSPHAFASGSNMHELLRESSALIPAEAYEGGFSHLVNDRFEFAQEHFESQPLDSAGRSEEHSAPRHDRHSKHASHKRGAAALSEAHDRSDSDGTFRQHRQRLFSPDETNQHASDQSDTDAQGQAHRADHLHEQPHYFHHHMHARAQQPTTERFDHGTSLHVDRLSSPLAVASSLAPLVFAAVTSPRLETKHGDKGVRYRHRSYALEALTSPLASALGVLPAPLDMAALESSELQGDDGDTGADYAAGFSNDSDTSELLSRRPAGPLLRRLNATTLSPGCRRAATAFVEKRQRRTANSTPRTMATRRWLQSMDPPALPRDDYSACSRDEQPSSTPRPCEQEQEQSLSARTTARTTASSLSPVSL